MIPKSLFYSILSTGFSGGANAFAGWYVLVALSKAAAVIANVNPNPTHGLGIPRVFIAFAAKLKKKTSTPIPMYPPITAMPGTFASPIATVASSKATGKRIPIKNGYQNHMKCSSDIRKIVISPAEHQCPNIIMPFMRTAARDADMPIKARRNSKAIKKKDAHTKPVKAAEFTFSSALQSAGSWGPQAIPIVLLAFEILLASTFALEVSVAPAIVILPQSILLWDI